MLVVDHNLQLLSTDPVGLRPQRVLFLHDLRVDYDAAQLVHDAGMAEHLLPDHGVVLVVGVVGITELSVRPEFELEELVPELTLVAHVVAEVEFVGIHRKLMESRSKDKRSRFCKHGTQRRIESKVSFLTFRDRLCNEDGDVSVATNMAIQGAFEKTKMV